MPSSPALCAARLRPLLLLPSAAATTPSALAAAAPAHTKQGSFSTTVRTTGMAAAEGAKASTQPPAAGGGGASERIMPHLLNIYGSCATARDFEMYAPNATFEDPLMCAHGVKQIKSAFYTMPKVFGESKIVEYTIKENATGPGKSQILIDNKQHYKVFGKPVDLESLITLDIEEGKVVRHQDWWDKKPLKNRETVSFPLVGRLLEASRRGAMLVTHVLMGCGKDPTP
ncbi:uncharacterized protein LOC123445634 [Hordeum vulgare subsp. vulgare]|uniref:Predicted protein n=1 Tax=Hordeum vulgare subsp. vulgare TaxID=112509 RepID=F2D457_HORVV|nr:uncharacterized protein LOC123445634 [Hordeum vulgare subsp. vulgare]BAJ89878.1 predicted protein [Hordeum vulgare subsp. vulgare]BAJ91040.1 predicted protein [Hordeum vulgare subsp. vulgare]